MLKDYLVLRTVNVRQGPGSDHHLLGQLRPGAILSSDGLEDNGYICFWWYYPVQPAWIWARNVQQQVSFQWDAWPTDYRVITQPFGVRPEYYGRWNLPGHEGLDIRAPEGSGIYAVAPGTVYRVEPEPAGNYGIQVRVAHEGGYKTVYAHLRNVCVDLGQVVQAGDRLGDADTTGNAWGSHLHLTMKREGGGDLGWPYDIVDPTPWANEFLGRN